VIRLLVTANVVPSSPILVTLMMEEIRSSETSVLTKATRRHIPDDSILLKLATFMSTVRVSILVGIQFVLHYFRSLVLLALILCDLCVK
jgi:hypothetical protein